MSHQQLLSICKHSAMWRVDVRNVNYHCHCYGSYGLLQPHHCHCYRYGSYVLLQPSLEVNKYQTAKHHRVLMKLFYFHSCFWSIWIWISFNLNSKFNFCFKILNFCSHFNFLVGFEQRKELEVILNYLSVSVMSCHVIPYRGVVWCENQYVYHIRHSVALRYRKCMIK